MVFICLYQLVSDMYILWILPEIFSIVCFSLIIFIICVFVQSLPIFFKISFSLDYYCFNVVVYFLAPLFSILNSVFFSSFFSYMIEIINKFASTPSSTSKCWFLHRFSDDSSNDFYYFYFIFSFITRFFYRLILYFFNKLFS